MLKRLRAKHPVGFCVLSEVLFLGSLLLASYLIVFALVLFGVDLERVDSYFLSAVQEAVGMVVALVILGRTGKMYLLRRRGSGFFNGLLVGMYPLVLIGYSLYTKLMFGMPEDGQLQPAFSIFSFFLSMALVGVAEEFIFRGVIAQSLLERFGTGRAGESLSAVGPAVWRGPPDQSAVQRSLRCADAVCLCGIAGHAVRSHLFPHRQPVGHGVPARGHGHCLYAGGRPVRYGGRGREHFGL